MDDDGLVDSDVYDRPGVGGGGTVSFAAIVPNIQAFVCHYDGEDSRVRRARRADPAVRTGAEQVKRVSSRKKSAYSNYKSNDGEHSPRRFLNHTHSSGRSRHPFLPLI